LGITSIIKIKEKIMGTKKEEGGHSPLQPYKPAPSGPYVPAPKREFRLAKLKKRTNNVNET
tara:strand:- start:220 stop:402 length:183 start_codon:yes stop_codon:yes gene_type:complete